jgi:hypothetical protein
MDHESSLDKPRLCQPGEDSDNIKLDREFQNLIPPLSASELDDLNRSLDAERGCRDALVVWKGHNTLVDGHNRLRYCREKGYPFPVIEKEFADRNEVRAFIISTQLGRRNLSPAAESYLRGKRYLETKKQGARSDKTSGQSDQKTTAEKLGEEFKVGEKTVRRDARFAEAVDQIDENCGQDARNLILSRETGLTRGGVLRLAKLKPEDQKKFLESLKETGKRPRKTRKTGKRRERITLPAEPRALVQALVKELDSAELSELAKALAEAIDRRPRRRRSDADCSRTAGSC